MQIDPVDDWKLLLEFYNLLVKHGELSKLVWTSPAADQITFPEFYRSHNLNHVCHMLKCEGEFVGVFYLSEIFGVHRTNAGLWVSPQVRGQLTMELTKRMVEYIHRTLGIKYAYYMSPWRTVRAVCKKLEIPIVATLPGYHSVNGKDLDVNIYMTSISVVKLWLYRYIAGLGYGGPKAVKQMVERLMQGKKAFQMDGGDA